MYRTGTEAEGNTWVEQLRAYYPVQHILLCQVPTASKWAAESEPYNPIQSESR